MSIKINTFLCSILIDKYVCDSKHENITLSLGNPNEIKLYISDMKLCVQIQMKITHIYFYYRIYL